jgi:superfamily I DNA/RNA helicase/mRNA-degrading endonuclease RelE of RelBE toxin-antitoxin system
MEFRISDTFTDSLSRLTGDEQKAVKTTAFDLQLDPASPGMSFHKLTRAKDKNFWSIRVSSDIRLIVHKTKSSLLLCYVDHHDAAYHWAETRKLERHPKTGAAQFVEIRETVVEVPTMVHVVEEISPAVKPPLFASISEEDLLGYGVPEEWLEDVLKATEDTILDLAEHLPGEAAEALLVLATGGTPKIAPVITKDENPFDHPDALRRFRVMSNVEELERALDYPWEKWTVFLHPSQREAVERDYNGPARVSGSAGTGKTIVALHRAVHLARKDPDSRVLLTTFSDVLAKALQIKLKRLVSNEPRIGERLEVHSINTLGLRLHERLISPPKIAPDETISRLIREASADLDGPRFHQRFLMSEWTDVVDAWQLRTWEEYRDVLRLGRKTRLPEKQRSQLWEVFSQVRERLSQEGLMTLADLFSALAEKVSTLAHSIYDYAIVDEAQDVSVPQLRFLAALAANRQNGLFFAGDLGQRIFQTPFSWTSLGVEIRGRCQTLRVNYRTSHQIRTQADRLLGPTVADVDGNVDDRRGTTSVFNGPAPAIKSFDSEADEVEAVSAWLQERYDEGIVPNEIGVFVRSDEQLSRAEAAISQTGIPYRVLDERLDVSPEHASLCTMHLAKGLEFRVVVVMACDDEVIPLQERIESISDNADLEEVYNTERHLLYVACTRARDHLLVTSTDPCSEFLDDLLDALPVR